MWPFVVAALLLTAVYVERHRPNPKAQAMMLSEYAMSMVPRGKYLIVSIYPTAPWGIMPASSAYDSETDAISALDTMDVPKLRQLYLLHGGEAGYRYARLG